MDGYIQVSRHAIILLSNSTVSGTVVSDQWQCILAIPPVRRSSGENDP